MSERALDLMWALRLESGQTWGELATEVQIADAEAIHSPERPNLHFITRPRGGSKTTDIAALALSWLAIDAPPLANGHVVASNTEQAAILIDAAAAIVARTPELENVIHVENERLIAPNGAWVRVLPQSSSGSWGLRDAHLLICDEFCQWEETRGAKRVWTAMRSTVQKVPGCRLIILSSAGEPSHWSRKIFEAAETDPLWRTSEMPGPVPWQSPEDIAGLKRDLLPSEFERLVLNRWAESEDRAISPEDYEAAVQPSIPFGVAPAGLTGGGHRLRFAQPSVEYIITVDIGIKNDSTVLTVSHKEPINSSIERPIYRLIVDHLERWTGSKKHHVQIDDVKNKIINLSSEYNNARVYADPYQFAGGVQALNLQGVVAIEWPFTATSVGQVATSLVQVFHNRQIYVPESYDLKEELLMVKLRESTPGVTRLFHDKDKHDDQAVAIGMAANLLISSQQVGQGAIWMEMMKDELKKRADSPLDLNPRDDLVMFLRSGMFQPPPELSQAGNCLTPRYFGPEKVCINCGKTPTDHAQRAPDIAKV